MRRRLCKDLIQKRRSFWILLPLDAIVLATCSLCAKLSYKSLLSSKFSTYGDVRSPFSLVTEQKLNPDS